MKKIGVFIFALFMVAAAAAQDKSPLSSSSAQKNILNHMDVGVNVGTVGIGIDVAMPIGNYVRVRAGYNYMPRFTIHTNFNIETRNGNIGKYIEKIKDVDIKQKMKDVGVDPNDPKFDKYMRMADDFSNVEPKDQVTMNLKPNLHQFKFLVDVMPFKKNKHWSFTTGFFVGPSNVGEACNQDDETLLLKAVTAYNDIYVNYCQNGIEGNYHEKLDEIFYKNGIAGVPIGYFADGDKAMMVPNKDNSVCAEMKVSKIRPYLGFGYNTSLSRDKKWKLNVDAGVLFLCGKPNVYVNNVYKINEKSINPDKYIYDIVRPNEEWTDFIVDEPLQHIDLMNDVHDIPGKVGDIVDKVSKLKVYPNVSVTFSYRIF